MPEINILDLAISLIITIAVYSLPIILVRYLILRHPIDRHRAKIITLVYAFLGLVIMVLLIYWLTDGNGKVTGGAIFLWSYVNYKMLTTGKDKRYNTKSDCIKSAKTETNELLPILSLKKVTNENNVIQITPTKKVAKMKYCKNCGGPIDYATKKCEGCGKQYCHIPKLTLSRCIVAIVITALVGLSTYQYIANNQKTVRLTEDLKTVQSNYKTILVQYGDLYTRVQKAELENVFWDSNVVICTPSGEKYHEYGCSHLVDRDYFVCTAEEAKRRGYLPCLDCCSAWDIMSQSSK